MRRTGSNCFLATLLFVALATSANAQNYSIPWHTIAGGGGSSSGGSFSLSGTIGQPATATLTGGNYTVTGGFWSIYSVVQTAGLPVLSVKVSGPNVLVSWSAAAGNFTLQNNPGVKNPAGWAAVSQSPVTANGTNTVTIPISAGALFFRLNGQ